MEWSAASTARGPSPLPSPPSTGERGWRLIALVILLCSAPALAQQVLPYPRLDAVFPFSGKAGTTIENLTVAGDILEGAQGLAFTHPGIKAEPVMSKPTRFYPDPRPEENRFKVTIAPDVPPGQYELRLTNRMGVSNARTFIVGDVPESIEAEPNNNAKEATPLPVNAAASGQCDDRGYDRYKLPLKAGQRVIIHCAARRADTKTDAVLVLHDPSGSLLVRAHDAVRLDSTIDFTPTADGDYTLSVNDFLFRGGPDFGYRLSVTAGPWIEFIDPPFAAPGGSGNHTVYGRNLPGSSPAPEVKGSDGRPLEKLTVTVQAPSRPTTDPLSAVETLVAAREASLETFGYRLSASNGLSNPVRLALAEGTLLPEQDQNDAPEQAQSLTLPAQVVGRFNPPRDRDWYTFYAKKGERLWIEVASQRLGLPTDPAIVVQQVVTGEDGKPQTDKDGKPVVRDVGEDDDVQRQQGNDDQRYRFNTDDPGLLLTVPADGQYRLMVKDLYATSQGEPRFFYLLSVRPAAPADFSLVAFTGRPDLQNAQFIPSPSVLRKGGSLQIDVLVTRRDGFDGPIRITPVPESLPQGVTALPAVIAPGAIMANVVLHAAADAPVTTAAIKLVGTAKVGDVEVVRPVLPAEVLHVPTNGSNTAPTRLVRELAVAVRDDVPAPATVQLGDGTTVYRVPRGGKLEVPVKVTRVASFTGNLDLRPDMMPPNVPGPSIGMENGAAEKKYAIDIDPGIPPGVFSFILRAEPQIPYERSPELTKQAEEDKTRIEGIAKKSQEDLQAAQQKQQQMEQSLNEATANAGGAEQQRQQMEQQLAQAKEREQQATGRRDELKTAFDAAAQTAKEAADALAKLNADGAADASAKAAAQQDATARQQAADQAKAQLDEAAKQLETESAAVKDSSEKYAAAEKAKGELDAKVVEVTKARDESVTAAQKAQTDQQESEQARQQAEQRFNQSRERSNKRDLKIQVHSQPAIVEIVPAPFTLALQPASLTLKAGGDPVDLTATLTREFAFAGEVRFELIAPDGVGGIGFADQGNLVAASQNSGALKLRADGGTKPGTYTFTLRAQYNFNGRDISNDFSEQRFDVTVQPAEKPS